MSGSDLDSFHRRVLKSFSKEYDGNEDNWDAAISSTSDEVDASTDEISEAIQAQKESQWRQLHAFLETDCGRDGEFGLDDIEREVATVFTESYSMWDDSEPPTEWISAETGLSQDHTNRILSQLYGTLLRAIETTAVQEVYACIPDVHIENGLDIQDTGTYATDSVEGYQELTESEPSDRERFVLITVQDADIAPRDLSEFNSESEPNSTEESDEEDPEEVEQKIESHKEYVIVDAVPSDQIRPYLI